LETALKLLKWRDGLSYGLQVGEFLSKSKETKQKILMVIKEVTLLVDIPVKL